VFIAGVNMVVVLVLLVICHSWLGCRVDRLIQRTEQLGVDQRSRIAAFNETVTDLPSVPGEYP